MKKILTIVFYSVSIVSLMSCTFNENINSGDVKQKIFESKGDFSNEKTKETNFSQLFKSTGLLTNTDKKSIDIDLVLGGGTAKDGIPTIDEPKFYGIEEAKQKLDFLDEESTGIAIEIDGVAKIYPYNILVWHKIVNDTLGGEDIAVTFFPLCVSAVVYRNIDGKKIRFGVSGKPCESNLLMYDDKTESLWIQSIG